MNIIDFAPQHIDAACIIARENYNEERGFVPALPDINDMPDLSWFAENKLGVAALEGDRLVGFLCAVGPIERPFQIDNLLGAYVPLHAHGAVAENRAGIYAAMYEVAAVKWLRTGMSNHAITLYAHDEAARTQFLKYRFAYHGIDAIREITTAGFTGAVGFTFTELYPHEFEQLLPLHDLMQEHFRKSPIFINFPSVGTDEFRQINERQKPRYFVVKTEKRLVAFIKISKHGETFFSGSPDMRNICGAYCLPEYRGTGLYRELLNFTAQKLRTEGIMRLGVDFESFNPNAYGFWLKHFTAYTHSVVRRIDEYAVGDFGGVL